MSASVTHDGQQQVPDMRTGIRKRIVQVLVTFLIQAAVLFLSSWRLDWWPAWVYIGLNLIGAAINASFMLRYCPETVAERAETRGMKEWDRIVAGLAALFHMVLTLLVAGLDARFGWTGQMDLAIQIAAMVAFALGSALFAWAMLSNAYFSTVVRIQEERGHTVCSTGPYRFVRHPGYVGAILQSLALPLFFGSLWAFVPAVLAVLLLVARTVLEDRTLQEELDGYKDYAQRVRYRLLPGIW